MHCLNLFSTQERGREVCSVLSKVCGENAAEWRAGGQALTHGDRLHPAEKPLPPLAAIQHPSSLHEQHLSGNLLRHNVLVHVTLFIYMSY